MATAIRDKEINGRLVPFEFSLLVSNKPDRIAICNLFRENLESIGIRCDVSPLEAAVLPGTHASRRSSRPQMSGLGRRCRPLHQQEHLRHGRRSLLRIGYSNPEVDRLFDEGELEFDREKRAEIYGKIHNEVFADQPYLFLYTRSSFYGFNKRSCAATDSARVGRSATGPASGGLGARGELDRSEGHARVDEDLELAVSNQDSAPRTPTEPTFCPHARLPDSPIAARLRDAPA